ncbi:MAG: HPr-rel-A system PqqD family peptide chaperone [Magnetococcales bacterium]|nr:HPr-rel-A system PqqD family peptide chaperone [Magnetococcales bacterium]
MPVAEGLRWHSPLGGSFLREWVEEVCFLYNPASGRTHVLNDWGMRILDHLTRQPLSQTELLDRFRCQTPEFAHTLAEHLPGLLRELDILGLIEPL